MGTTTIDVATISLEEEKVKATEITLSDGNFKDTVELVELDESWLSKAIFPTDETLALLAQLTYKDNLREIILSADQNRAFLTYENELRERFASLNKELNQSAIDSYKHNNLGESLRKVKEEWKLLTTARNKSDAYFGAAFFNSTEQQLVISHRGSDFKNPKVILTDIEGIISNRHTSQIDSACTFVAHVLRELSACKHIQISITGHSLGAWLAQVTTFSAEYLTIDREKNKFRVKSEEDAAYHVHCVGFESPGCRPMLTKLSEMYHERIQHLDHTFWTNLDISLYVTRPNMVNTFGKHVKKVYQIDIPPVKSVRKIARDYYTLHYHSMVNIVMAMCNGNQIKVVDNWPLVTHPEITSVSKFLKHLPCLIFKFIVTSGKEADEFWSNANDANDNSPEADKNTEFGIKLHYKVREVDTSLCNLNTFSKAEQLFLFCWPNETTLKISIKDEIREELPNFKLNSYDCLFKKFLYIENEQIKFDNFEVDELINFTKQLFRFFNEPKQFVKNLVKVTRANVSICKKFSDSYLQRVIVEHLEFKDTIGLNTFLSLDQPKQVFLIKTGFRFEVQRIYSILRSSQMSFICLDLTQLIHLNNYLYLSETIESLSDHVLVLDCQRENLNESELILLATLLGNTKTLKTIIVVQSKEAENRIKEAYKDNVTFVEHDNNLSFNDLTPESNTWFSQLIKDKVKLQGKNIDLLSFIGESDTLDCNIVAEIVKGNKILEIGIEPMKLCQAEASYAKRLKFIKAEYLINAFIINSNENEIFVITSSDEINFETFARLLPIKSEDDKRIMNESADIIFDAENANIDYSKGSKIIILKSGDEEHFKKICYSNSEKVVYWLEIINQQFYLHQIFVSDFYIKRNLFHDKCIKSDAVIDLSKSDRFVISLTVEQLKTKLKSLSGKEDLDNINIFSSLNEDETLNKFKEWCAESKDTPIHWLKETDGQLAWKQSHHSISKLRDYIDESCNKEIDEQTLAKLNDKVVVVVAEPGMGKSTTLTRLSEYKLDDSWVIRLNLRDYQSQILSLLHSINIESIVTFLIQVSTDNINNKLTRLLLKYCLNNKISRPLLILFDGYDEIESECQKILNKLLKYLKEKTFANLWITSREHFTADLENKLCVFSTTFKELDVDERRMFLKTYWQVRLKLELSESEFRATFGNESNNSELNKFRTFSNALLVKVDEVLDERMSKFMGIPLQMRLLAEGFLPQFEAFITSDSDNEVPHFKELNVAQIYERFIKVKFDIYFQEKTRLSFGLNEVSAKWFSNDVIKIHQKLALQLLFPDVSIHLLERDFVIKAKEEIELKRIGLLHSPYNRGELEFIHRTFAEYFVATFILNRLRKPIHKNQLDAIESLLKLIFQKFDVICSFLNEQISETDVRLVKTECFSVNIFSGIYKIYDYANIMQFIFSFFTNKKWLLNQIQFDVNLVIAMVRSKHSKITECFMKLIRNSYDVIRKNVIRPSYKIGSCVYKFKSNADAIYKTDKREKVKNLISGIKWHSKIIEELVKDFCVEDLCEACKGEEELFQFMRQFSSSSNEDKINRLMNSIRDKYENDCHDMLRQLDGFEKYRFRKDIRYSRAWCILEEFNSLLREVKPRRVIKDFQNLRKILEIINTWGIIAERIVRNPSRAILPPDQLTGLKDEQSVMYDITRILANQKEACQSLQRLKNDEKFSRLLELLKNFNKKEKVEEGKIKFKNNDADAIKGINSSVDIPKVFLCLKYYEDSLRSVLHKELKDEDKKKFVFHGFQNESQDLISAVPSSITKRIESFLSRVECDEAKQLLSYYLPILTMVDFTFKGEAIEELITSLLKHIEGEKIKTFQNVFDFVENPLNMTGAADSETEPSVVYIKMLMDALRAMFTFEYGIWFKTIEKINTLYLELMMRSSERFPGLFYLFIFKFFKLGDSIYQYLPQENVCLMFEFVRIHFPNLALVLAMTHFQVQETHIYYAIKYNYPNVLSLLFKILKPYPSLLQQLCLRPRANNKSCLHYAILHSEMNTLECFLTELNRNAIVMQYVIQNFASDEEEKLNLFEAAVINNAGALLIFLNGLKFHEIFKNYILPADASVKPAFYLAGERGCKEVMDALLSALKSEPDTLLKLLTWTDPDSGQTVLHRACERGYKEIVEALLHSMRKQPEKLKVLFLFKDKYERIALDCAILSERRIIRNNFNVDFPKKLIIDDGEYKILKLHFGDFDERCINSLHKLSCNLKNIPLVVNLILIFAKSFNNVELMLAIFENEDLKSVLEEMYITLDTYSYQLFYCSIERNSLELVKLLIAKGIEMNATNGYGFTPLMRAVCKNKVDIAKLLLANGADIYAKDMNNKSVISFARDLQYGEMMKLFHNN